MPKKAGRKKRSAKKRTAKKRGGKKRAYYSGRKERRARKK